MALFLLRLSPSSPLQVATPPIKPSAVRGLQLLSITTSKISNANWTVLVSVNLTTAYMYNISTPAAAAAVERRGRSLMASALTSWAEEDIYQTALTELQASAGMAFGVSSDGMVAEDGQSGGGGIASAQLRTLQMDPYSAARGHLSSSTLPGRVLSAWVREQAMPALNRARRDLASSLQQLDAMSLRSRAEEGGNSGPAGQGGRTLLDDPSPDTITLAQIMSMLSSLDTLNVGVRTQEGPSRRESYPRRRPYIAMSALPSPPRPALYCNECPPLPLPDLPYIAMSALPSPPLSFTTVRPSCHPPVWPLTSGCPLSTDGD